VVDADLLPTCSLGAFGRSFLGMLGRGAVLAKFLAEVGDVAVVFVFGNFPFMDVALHVRPVILESLLADLAVFDFRGPQAKLGGPGSSALQLLLLSPHSISELPLLASEVGRGVGLSRVGCTFSEERRKAGV
jgi:hypothetical protein